MEVESILRLEGCTELQLGFSSDERVTLKDVLTGSDVKLVLASASPRRRELLAGLGVEFTVQSADIDESVLPGERPEALVGRLSTAKAETVAAEYPDAFVIAADTVVVLDEDILGKPKDKTENERFIRRLANRTHEVYTGHALFYRGRLDLTVKCTEVTFRALSDDEVHAYVATGEGLDKAGGYAIQGYGAALIPHIKGCYFNVVGLSVATLAERAKVLGVRLV